VHKSTHFLKPGVRENRKLCLKVLPRFLVGKYGKTTWPLNEACVLRGKQLIKQDFRPRKEKTLMAVEVRFYGGGQCDSFGTVGENNSKHIWARTSLYSAKKLGQRGKKQ
jgi:hypothetical protein